jgi:hypothetical protein
MEWKNVEPNVWKPQDAEDKIEGVLVSVVPKGSEDFSNRYFLENKDGTWLVWGTTVLDDRMGTVKVGSIVRITYKGTELNKRKQATKIFKVEVGTE